MSGAIMPNTLYVLELRDIGDAIPVECRLRQILKRLLRDHHFRCTSVRLATQDRQQKQGSEPAGADTFTHSQDGDAVACSLRAMAAVEALPVEVDDLRDK